MTRRQQHWIEKLQVQVSTAAAVAVGYFLLWPLVCPPDPMGPLAFLAVGPAVNAALLAGAACAMALACGLITPTARPEGTMIAVLLGLGGLSLRSGPMREALWASRSPGRMYLQMAAETLLLAAVVLVAAAVARLARWAVGRAMRGMAWQDLLEVLSESQQREYLKSLASENGGDNGQDASESVLGGGFARIIVEHLGLLDTRATGRRMPGKAVLTRCGLCLMACLGITAALVWLLARSADRGQLLFALMAGSFLGTLIAYQLFPMRLSWAAWASPILAGVASYVLAMTAVGFGQASENSWAQVEHAYQALPIDWIAAGLGGSILGYWVSLRMHESRFLDRYEQPEEGA